MECIRCDKKENLWNVELYHLQGHTKNVSCCKNNDKCKNVLWKTCESQIRRKDKEDYQNGIEVWRTLFPKKPPKSLKKRFWI